MNKENVKKAIEVMQAYVDGKIIQGLYNGEWHTFDVDSTLPLFQWADCTYRIKPEPLVLFVNEHSITGDCILAYESKYEAIRMQVSHQKVFEFIQVLDDE